MFMYVHVSSVSLECQEVGAWSSPLLGLGCIVKHDCFSTTLHPPLPLLPSLTPSMQAGKQQWNNCGQFQWRELLDEHSLSLLCGEYQVNTDRRMFTALCYVHKSTEQACFDGSTYLKICLCIMCLLISEMHSVKTFVVYISGVSRGGTRLLEHPPQPTRSRRSRRQ